MARKRRRIVIRDRRKTALRLALAVLVLAAVVGVVVFTVLTVRKLNIRLAVRSVPLVSGEPDCGTEDGILYTKNGMLNFFSFKDEDNNFSKYLPGSPEGLAGTQGIKVSWSVNAVQIVDAPFDITPDGAVKTVRAGAKHVAVCTERQNGDEAVTVYNAMGQQVYALVFPSGSLAGFGFSEASGQTLWTMELSVDSGTPRTTVTTFDLSRMSATGVITVSGQLVEDVFFTNSSVFVVGTESLIRYSASANREIYRVQLHGYRVIDRTMDGDAVVLLLVPRNMSEVSLLRVLTVSQKDAADESAVTVTLDAGTVGWHLAGGSLMLVTESSVRRLDRKGKLVDSVSLPSGSTLSSEKLDDRHILLERSGEFDLLTIGK